jgi:tRNA(Met) C34 N-acetyltransferase TmcA
VLTISCLTSGNIALTSQELSFLFTPFDLKRLKSYAQNLLDYHVILDLLPTVAMLYFEKRLGEEVRLSAIQSSLLLGMGLQRKSVEVVEVRSHSCTNRPSSCNCASTGGTPAPGFTGTRTFCEAPP